MMKKLLNFNFPAYNASNKSSLRQKWKRIIIIISFSLFWLCFMQVSNIDTLSSYAIFVLKGLILAMINIVIMYKDITVKQLIIYCSMPFFINLLLWIKPDISSIYLIIPLFTNLLLLLEYLKQNFFNLDTLGGTPEVYEPSSFNLSTPGDQTGIPRGNNNPYRGPGGRDILNPYRGPGGRDILNPVGNNQLPVPRPGNNNQLPVPRQGNNQLPVPRPDNNNPQVNNNPRVNNNPQVNFQDVFPRYPRDNRTLRGVYINGVRNGDHSANSDAINDASRSFRAALHSQGVDTNLVGNALVSLKPKMEELITKFENRDHNLTISDCAEAKLILSLCPYHEGLRFGTKGFYNRLNVERYGNSITATLNGHMFLRRALSRDLRTIKNDVS